MPRPKKYVRSQALESARDMFWQHGYDALGVRAIEEGTGLNRFAIQTEFGGKEGLFLEALDNYAEESIDVIIGPIRRGGLQAIRQFFIDMTTPQDDDCRVFGCLMVNTVVENASHLRSELKKRTDAHYDRMLVAFKSALQNARDEGELNGDVDIEDASSFLLALAMGIQVYIRMKSSIPAARQQSDMALKILDSWRASPS